MSDKKRSFQVPPMPHSSGNAKMQFLTAVVTTTIPAAIESWRAERESGRRHLRETGLKLINELEGAIKRVLDHGFERDERQRAKREVERKTDRLEKDLEEITKKFDNIVEKQRLHEEHAATANAAARRAAEMA
jgi:hypothetical protein